MEQVVKHCNVVRGERFFIPFEGGFHFGQNLRQIDFHFLASQIFGRGDETTPVFSSSQAMRNAMSSRHGAQMICTPIGSGASGTGTATTGRPMKEIGWV